MKKSVIDVQICGRPNFSLHSDKNVLEDVGRHQRKEVDRIATPDWLLFAAAVCRR